MISIISFFIARYLSSPWLSSASWHLVCSLRNQGDRLDYDVSSYEHIISIDDLDRSGEEMIAIAEAKLARGEGGIKVLDIPDGVDYIVESGDDGREWVAEVHRTWS